MIPWCSSARQRARLRSGSALQALVIVLLLAVVGDGGALAPLFPMIVVVPVGAYLALLVASDRHRPVPSVAGLEAR